MAWCFCSCLLRKHQQVVRTMIGFLRFKNYYPSLCMSKKHQKAAAARARANRYLRAANLAPRKKNLPQFSHCIEYTGPATGEKCQQLLIGKKAHLDIPANSPIQNCVFEGTSGRAYPRSFQQWLTAVLQTNSTRSTLQTQDDSSH